MSRLYPIEFLQECRKVLLKNKQDLLNRVSTSKKNFFTEDRSGDEMDQAASVMRENQFLSQQERMLQQVYEIELALAKIESGTYGFCEITEEPIEKERLRTLPWTRWSIEGAEIYEAMNRKSAR